MRVLLFPIFFNHYLYTFISTRSLVFLFDFFSVSISFRIISYFSPLHSCHKRFAITHARVCVCYTLCVLFQSNTLYVRACTVYTAFQIVCVYVPYEPKTELISVSIYRCLSCLQMRVCARVDFKRFDCDSFYFNFHCLVHRLFLFLFLLRLLFFLILHSSSPFGLFSSFLLFAFIREALKLEPSNIHLGKASRTKLYTKMMIFLIYTRAHTILAVYNVWSGQCQKRKKNSSPPPPLPLKQCAPAI